MSDKFSNATLHCNATTTIPDGDLANQDINLIQPTGTSRIDAKVKNSSGVVTTNQITMQSATLTNQSVVYVDSNGLATQDNANFSYDQGASQLNITSQRAGDATDNVSLSSTGVTLNGTARVTKSEMHNAADFVLTTSSPPSLSVVSTFSATYYCAPGSLSQFYGAFRLPSDYEAGTDITWYAQWAPQTASVSGNVRFLMDYKGVTPNTTDAINGTPTNLVISSTGSATAFGLVETSGATISGSGLQVGDEILYRGARDGANAADTYSGRVFLVGYRFEYISNRLGE